MRASSFILHLLSLHPFVLEADVKGISLAKQQFVVTHRYPVAPATARTGPVLNTPTFQQVTFVRKCKDNQSFVYVMLNNKIHFSN
jgi:hypothetical protein